LNRGVFGTLHPEVGFGFGFKEIERMEMRVRSTLFSTGCYLLIFVVFGELSPDGPTNSD
jgi:hypothetical protein